MSYPDIDSENFIEELLKRKEFYSFKVDDYNFRNVIENDPIIGKYLKLHSHQLFASNFINPNTPYKRLHLLHGTGCHAKDTSILMYDGEIKMVQDIRPGDQLMGDDNAPRTVLNLARGREKMFKLQTNGKCCSAYIFNENHILSLAKRHGRGNKFKFIDINLTDYLAQITKFQLNGYKFYKVQVNFPEQPIIGLTPYELGKQLGWAYSNKNKWADFPNKNIANIVDRDNNNGNNLGNNFKEIPPEIPKEYKINSQDNILKLLAGIIDSAAILSVTNNCYIMTIFSANLAADIKFICNLVGLQVREKQQIYKSQVFCKLIISGDIWRIPCQYSGKFNHGINHIANQYTLIDFKLIEVPEDDYYGFTLDGNGRFLGRDCTVLHNTGKTLCAIAIAQNFINTFYKPIYESVSMGYINPKRSYVEIDKKTPSVFIFGFGGTKIAFITDLIKYPEFGFISLAEKDELFRKQVLADSGLAEDIKSHREYFNFIRRRITNKIKDGFYKFYGYDEFVNRLFISDEIKLTELEAQANYNLKTGKSTKTFEELIREKIKEGKIRINTDLLKQFENSLIICDEVHNTYNMIMKNNRGIAIQYLLDTIPSLRAVFMSATPINNSPTEVVELINFLVPIDQKVTKQDLFKNNRELLPGALEKIGKLVRNRISFLQNTDPQYFPKRIIEGEPYLLPHDVHNLREHWEIPYLKFVHCPMSEYHQNTYFNFVKNREKMLSSPVLIAFAPETEIELTTPAITVESEEITSPVANIEEIEADLGFEKTVIPTDGYAIYDMCFPGLGPHGVFKSAEVRNVIQTAPQTWRDEVDIHLKKYSVLNSIIYGNFLKRDNLGKYSAKYAAMFDKIIETIHAAGGNPLNTKKIMIYHDRVKLSGVLLIQEILKANNFIDETSDPTDSTICCICGKPMITHDTTVSEYDITTSQQNVDSAITAKIKTHVYRPARFIMAHSDMEKIIMDQSLQKYNSGDNYLGHKFMILVGSRIIKESYTFKDTEMLFIMSKPTNIPTMLQVFGRVIRHESLNNLPPERRAVHIYIFMNVINKSLVLPPDTDLISPEAYGYIEKILDYIVIQNIEREMNKNAIDGAVHRDIVMSPHVYKEYFPAGATKPVDRLGNLYFDIAKAPTFTPGELNLSTFMAYNYNIEETKFITVIIKRLFIKQHVWSYGDLWSAVRKPPYKMEINPGLFDENNFIVALQHLIEHTTVVVNSGSIHAPNALITESFLIERLFDYNDKYIYHSGYKYKICQIGEYYISFPVKRESLHFEAAGNESIEHGEQISIDVETYLRPSKTKQSVKVRVNDFIKHSRSNIHYLAQKNKFVAEFDAAKINLILYKSASFQQLLLEEAIAALITNETIPANMTAMYKTVIEFYTQFNITIFAAEVSKYKTVVAQYKHGLPKINKNIPLGYVNAKNVRLFDVTEGKWFEINKLALNRYVVFKENEIVIGYFESGEDYSKFKLRKPIHKIKSEFQRESEIRKLAKTEMASHVIPKSAIDTRLIEKGVVCSTKSKEQLLQIISDLGISISSLDKSEVKIKKFCELIQKRLIDSEIKERQKDSKWKYLYLWDVELPSYV